MSETPPDPASSEPTLPKRDWLALVSAPLLLILLLTGITYAQNLRAGFVFDDLDLIVKNRPFLEGERIGEYASEYRFRQELMRSYKRDLRLSGGRTPDPHIFHATNVLTHLLVVSIFYGLLLLAGKRARFSLGERLTLATLGAGLLALHPIESEAVAYVTGRADLLAALYTLLALIAFWVPLRWCPESAVVGEVGPAGPECALPDRKYWMAVLGSWAVCLLLFVKALLCKEAAAVLPAFIVLVAFFLPGRVSTRQPHIFVMIGLLFLVVVTALIARFAAFGTFGSPDVKQGLFFTMGTNAWAVVRYFGLWVFPVWQNADHYFPVLPLGFFDLKALLGLAFICVLVLVAWGVRKRAPEISLGLLWFLVGLAPANSVIPIEDILVERRLYLPSLGLCLAAAGLMVRYARRWYEAAGKVPGWFRARRAILAVVTAVLMLVTGFRSLVWSSELSLWADASQKAPLKKRPFYNLGTALLKAGYPEQALTAFSQLFNIDGMNVRLHLNVGTAFLEAGWVEQALWIFKNNVLSLDPDNVEARYNLAVIYERRDELDKAQQYLEEAIRLDPNMEQAHVKLGTYAFNRDESGEALEHFNKAVELDPDDPVARRYLALLYAEVLGQTNEAIPHLEALTRIEPNVPQHWFSLATLEDRGGQIQKARDHYEKAIRLKPDFAGAYINYGAMLARRDNLAEACPLLERGARLDPAYVPFVLQTCPQLASSSPAGGGKPVP